MVKSKPQMIPKERVSKMRMNIDFLIIRRGMDTSPVPILLLPTPNLSRREHQASGVGMEERETIFALAWLNCVQLTDFFFKRLSKLTS